MLPILLVTSFPPTYTWLWISMIGTAYTEMTHPWVRSVRCQYASSSLSSWSSNSRQKRYSRASPKTASNRIDGDFM